NKADFWGATFSKEAYFTDATFFGSVKFIDDENGRIFDESASANFSNSNFEHPESVEFVSVNLNNASFLHCKNIDKIGKFEIVDWNSKDIFLGFLEIEKQQLMRSK
ncbi:MAG: hypothetical protein COV98_04020, partial [Candidatus Altarchaeum sp. CG12_big_fil_rev_8_21_14_0_65_33_22]